MPKRLTATILTGAFAAMLCAAGAQAREEGPTEVGKSTEARPLVCKVFLSQYKDGDRPFMRAAALPYEPLKNDGRRVKIRRVGGRQATKVGVKEVGPWSMNDAYWHPESRREWEGLPRCVPEAQAAYQRGYNGGRDQFGRDVLNPAGIDVTPPVARELGLKRYQQGAWVYVTFPWVRQ